MSAGSLRAPISLRARRRLTRLGFALDPGPRELPTYFIVGGKRCGTTSLDEYLVGHPLVMRGLVVKGSRYYDVNYERGAAWFRRNLPPQHTVDSLARRLGSRPIFGESSPYYCFHPDAPRRIAADVPQARIIMCIRDPIARAWSHHRYETARGFETLSFEDALHAEESRLQAQSPTERAFAHRHFSYLGRSRYGEQIERLRTCFPAGNIHIVDADRLFVAPGDVMAAVFSHLGLDPHRAAAYPAHKALPALPVPPAATRWLSDRLADDLVTLDGVLDFEPLWRSRP